MNRNIKIIFLSILFFLFGLTIFSMSFYKKTNEPIGMACFDKCNLFCLNSESKVISFGATTTSCSCVCLDKSQVIIRN